MDIPTWRMLSTEEFMGMGAIWLQGTITARREQIEAVLGAPQYEFGGKETGDGSVEWDLLFADGVVATLYGIEQYGRGRPVGADEVTTWHVGGASALALDYVRALVS